MQIRKENKRKIALTRPERSFELTMIFFRLTNLPAMFQIMMNEILQDLINTGKVASFIDDIIVGEEGHNDIVEEVVRRLQENNLYVKLEKYK